MSYDLIDAQDVNRKKLISLFRNAYINASENDENSLIIEIDDDKILLAIEKDRDRLSLMEFKHGIILKGHENEILKKAMEINSEYALLKFQASFHDENDYVKYEQCISYDIKFNRGLNFAQLLDDARFFVLVKKAMNKEMLTFLLEKNVLKD